MRTSPPAHDRQHAFPRATFGEYSTGPRLKLAGTATRLIAPSLLIGWWRRTFLAGRPWSQNLAVWKPACRPGGSTGPSGLSIFHLVFFYFPLSPPVALSASPSPHPGKTRPTYLTTRPAPAPTRQPWICIGNAGQSAGRLLDHTRARETTLPPSHEAVDCMTWTLFRLYWRAGLVNGPKKFLSLQIPFGWTKNKKNPCSQIHYCASKLASCEEPCHVR